MAIDKDSSGEFRVSYSQRHGVWCIGHFEATDCPREPKPLLVSRNCVEAVTWMMMLNGDSCLYHPLQTLQSFWAVANDLTPAAEHIAHFLLALHQPERYRMTDTPFLQMDQQQLDKAHALWEFIDAQEKPLTFWLSHLGHTITASVQLDVLAERWAIPAVAV